MTRPSQPPIDPEHAVDRGADGIAEIAEEDEAHLSAAELAAANDVAELSQALRHALAPTEISAARHAQLLAQAFEDPLAAPSQEEERAAAALRAALEQPLAGVSADARVLIALGHAAAPRELEPARHESLLRAALTQRPKVVYLAFGALGTALAAAAAFAFLLRPLPAPEAPELASSRSLSELFTEHPGALTASERMDRIVASRAHDLRENRYRAWGVR